MIEVNEIERAIAAGDAPVLEAAFRALVTFPQEREVAGAKSVDTLCRLLTRVTRALQNDDTAMPTATVDLVAAGSGEPMPPGSTYAAGARIVAEHLYHWRGVYLQYAANAGKL